jgi:biopolymer transport protein ExbD
METAEIQWNGTPVTLDQVSGFLAQTRAMAVEPELQFQPAPNAPYDVVDKTLVVIKRSKVSKFGFVGNDAYAVFGKAANKGG